MTPITPQCIAAGVAARQAKARGTRINQKGYVEYTTGPEKGRLEHSVVVERALGRPLLPRPFEEIHHANGIKTDNRIENLIVMTREEHARLHARERHALRTRDELGRFSGGKLRVE